MKTIRVRLSYQRCGNTFLTECIHELTSCKNKGEILSIIGKEIYSYEKAWWKKVKIDDIIYIIEKYNLDEFNLMDNFKFIKDLNSKYNVILYSLERKNKLKSILSAIIKFNNYDINIIKQKRKSDIISDLNKIEKCFDHINSIVSESNRFYFENLMENGKINDNNFKLLLSTIDLNRNDVDISNMRYKEKNIIKSNNIYYEFIDEEILEDLVKETGYCL
jgi:hypothetical protein